MAASGGSLGSLVRSLRKARNWTQEELAEAAGSDQATISGIETGKRARVSVDVFHRLAGALEVPVSELLRAAGIVEPLPDWSDDPLAEIRADTLLMSKLREMGADNPRVLHDLLDNPVIQAYLEKRRRERGGGMRDGFWDGSLYRMLSLLTTAGAAAVPAPVPALGPLTAVPAPPTPAPAARDSRRAVPVFQQEVPRRGEGGGRPRYRPRFRPCCIHHGGRVTARPAACGQLTLRPIVISQGQVATRATVER